MDTPLKRARIRAKQSTYDVASALGIDQGGYWRIENGERCPTPELARRISAHFAGSVEPMEIMDPIHYMQQREPYGESD